jgi:hypothetical protein
MGDKRRRKETRTIKDSVFILYCLEVSYLVPALCKGTMKVRARNRDHPEHPT